MYGCAAGLGALGFLTLDAIGGGRPTDGHPTANFGFYDMVLALKVRNTLSWPRS